MGWPCLRANRTFSAVGCRRDDGSRSSAQWRSAESHRRRKCSSSLRARADSHELTGWAPASRRQLRSAFFRTKWRMQF
ncbi:hypothetical protein C0J52_27692 [Blattella germanica]|nr:hypothetical protein C0J52_27692 [Blattella germanica]